MGAPLVFYSGFTRSFLDGEQSTSAQLCERISTRIDELAKGRRVIIVDGVGFPAVGSIVGVDNADVARAARAPVLLVCKSGVGAAIDYFSLNSSYFVAKGVPVLGAVFNFGALEGFDRWQSCAEYIDKWFSLPAGRRERFHYYGVVPVAKELVDLREHISETTADQCKTLAALNASHFSQYADVTEIFRDAVADVWNRDGAFPVSKCSRTASESPPTKPGFVPPARSEVEAGAKKS